MVFELATDYSTKTLYHSVYKGPNLMSPHFIMSSKFSLG